MRKVGTISRRQAIAGGALALAARSEAAGPRPGTPDRTFGRRGIVTEVIGPGARAQELLVQPDGKLLVCTFLNRRGFRSEIQLRRYTADGVVDPTFGDFGWTRTGVRPYGIPVLQKGEFILSWGARADFLPGLVLERYTSNGRLDRGFQANGQLDIPFGGYVTSMGAQSDGSILFLRFASPEEYEPTVTLTRLRPDGSLDEAFGNGGTVQSDNTPYVIRDMRILEDDRIVVLSDGAGHGRLTRFLPNGEPDRGFGPDGSVDIPIKGSLLRVAPDGAMVVSGRLPDGASGFRVARLLASGAADGAFGSGGASTFTLPGVESVAVVSDCADDGRLLVVGLIGRKVRDIRVYDGHVGVLSPDGTPFLRFGKRGSIKTRIGFGSGWTHGVWQGADRVVVAGGADVDAGGALTLGRFVA